MSRLLALLTTLSSLAITLAPASPEMRRPEDLVLIQKGTLPIIVSAPHGGRKMLPDVPPRQGKGILNFQTILDSNTVELTEQFTAELEKQLDGKPWVVVAHFERKYLDVNRASEHGCESDRAKPYYDLYHASLQAACKAVKTRFGKGLLLDIHGQGEFPEAICRGTRNGKTVKLLQDRDGWAALTGKRSVLGRLQRMGYKVLPSCDADEKTREEPKYSGGHIVDTYGSHTGYGIDAIQLEFGSDLRAKQKNRYAETARDLATAVAVFHDEYLKDTK